MNEEPVSIGTFRMQDQIPAFLAELLRRDPAAHRAIGQTHRLGLGLDESSPWWQSEESAQTLEALFDALDAAAPKGFHFGSHPGNSSALGFWPNEEHDDD